MPSNACKAAWRFDTLSPLWAFPAQLVGSTELTDRKCLESGELVTGPGTGVANSQEDRLSGSLLRLSLGTACCSSPAKTMHLWDSLGGAAVMLGKWVAGAGSVLSCGRPLFG